MVSKAQKTIERAITRVDTTREYNISQMTQSNLFPWYKDIRSYRKSVLTDMRDMNLLKAKCIGEGKGRTYTIKGKHIVTYLKTLGLAMMLSNQTLHGKTGNTRKASSGPEEGRI